MVNNNPQYIDPTGDGSGHPSKQGTKNRNGLCNKDKGHERLKYLI